MGRVLNEFIPAKECDGQGLSGGGILIGSPGNIHQSFVFKVLKDQFGPPHTTYIGEKITWLWYFKTPYGFLTVYDYNGAWSVGYRSVDNRLNLTNLSDDLKREAFDLATAIINEANKIKIPNNLKKDKKGGSILNPYALYSNTAQSLIKESELIIQDIKQNRGKEIYYELNRSKSVAALYRSSYMANFQSLEGFINLIYTLFIKNRYKHDFYEGTLRNMMLPQKLLEMDQYCHSFKKQVITMGEELFKAFQFYVNSRNTLMHSNISEAMQAQLVQVGEDYLLARGSKTEKYGIVIDPNYITNIHVYRTELLVRKIIIRIINSLDDIAKYPFAIVYSYWWINYIIEDEERVTFPLTEDDFVPEEEIHNLLSESTDLDDDYYKPQLSEYDPPANMLYRR